MLGKSSRPMLQTAVLSYLHSALLCQHPQSVFELVNASYCVSASVEVYQSCGLSLLSLLFSTAGIQHADWDCTVRSSDGGEFYIANAVDLFFG